jgi:hypothetical protein
VRKLELPGLREKIEVDLLTQRECAAHYGCSLSLIHQRCKRLGLKTQRTGPRSGERHPNWKGGTKQVGRYLYRYQPDHPLATKSGYVLDHRLKMEAHLGRALLRSEVVHHRNGDPLDNRIENLEVFQTNADHLRHELKGRPAHPNQLRALRRSREARRRRVASQRSSKGGARPRSHRKSRR